VDADGAWTRMWGTAVVMFFLFRVVVVVVVVFVVVANGAGMRTRIE